MALRRAAPSMESQTRIAKKMDAMKEGGTTRMNSVTGPYPFTAFAPDSRDNRFLELRTQINSGVVPQYQLTEDDLQYAIQQKQQVEQLQFDKWAWNLYDQRDPAIREWYRSTIDPNMYDRMLSYLNGALENAKRWSKINMMGPSNKEDLEFIYALQQGKIHVPRSILPESLDEPLPAEYNRSSQGLRTAELGIFNPFRWVNKLPIGFTGYGQNQANVTQMPVYQSRYDIGIVPKDVAQNAAVLNTPVVPGQRYALFGSEPIDNEFGAVPGVWSDPEPPKQATTKTSTSKKK